MCQICEKREVEIIKRQRSGWREQRLKYGETRPLKDTCPPLKNNFCLVCGRKLSEETE